jgi:hypothetical protein
MLPSVSQSVSKNPMTAAIAAYLFSISNRTSSSLETAYHRHDRFQTVGAGPEP